MLRIVCATTTQSPASLGWSLGWADIFKVTNLATIPFPETKLGGVHRNGCSTSMRHSSRAGGKVLSYQSRQEAFRRSFVTGRCQLHLFDGRTRGVKKVPGYLCAAVEDGRCRRQTRGRIGVVHSHT